MAAKLNFSKCSILSVKHRDPIVKEDACNIQLQRCDKVKDLGVIIDSSPTFEDHIVEKVNKAYSVLGLIKRNFEQLGERCICVIV